MKGWATGAWGKMGEHLWRLESSRMYLRHWGDEMTTAGRCRLYREMARHLECLMRPPRRLAVPGVRPGVRP